MDNLLFQYQQGLMTEEYYTSGIQGPMAFFAPGVLGIVDDGSRRPSFRAELEKALADRDAHTHRRF